MRADGPGRDPRRLLEGLVRAAQLSPQRFLQLVMLVLLIIVCMLILLHMADEGQVRVLA